MIDKFNDSLNVTYSITVVIPVYNGAGTLRQCLDSVFQTKNRFCECIVVDDASTDDSAEIARSAGARVISAPARDGPAHARNLGARAALGDFLLFIDADVCLHASTLARVVTAFAEDPAMDALIGSYDFEPGAPNFLSQYKNLFHSFVHHHARRDASTFWTGCGAIRRSTFLATGGFPEHWKRPSVEDIEFGAAIRRLGGHIRLDPDLQVKHLKRWNLSGLLRTDIFDRAVPWTVLMLRNGAMPNDLNLRIDQRFCVALVCLAPLLALRFPTFACLLVLLAILLNLPLYRFLAARRGWWFAVRALPLHLLYFLYSGLAMIAGAALYVVEDKPQTVQLAIHEELEPAAGRDLNERPVDIC